jgi:hypothetical protein
MVVPTYVSLVFGADNVSIGHSPNDLPLVLIRLLTLITTVSPHDALIVGPGS